MGIARAPVRISFGGGGTDLPAYYSRFGGLVVSAAINRYCYAIARPALGGSVQIASADYATWQTYSAGQLPDVAEPLALPKAVLERFASAGLTQRGIDLFLASEVTPGTGLGSSSAMTVALLRAVAGYLGIELSAAELGEIASEIEIERLGMPIGKQDQYASAFGGLNIIEFSDHAVDVTPLDLPDDLAAALNTSLLLFSTGRSRNSADILRQQSADTGTNRSVTASLHRIKGLAREMIDALQGGDLNAFGGLLDVAWQEKKRLSGRISTSDIDAWYAAARAAGALGGKITGAGGGGFLLLYCPPERQPALRATLTELGLRELLFDFDWSGAELLTATELDPLQQPAIWD